MPERDSLDKIIGTYMKLICAETFTYNGKKFDPSPISVSPMIFRGFVCPAKCGGCCPRFSLDYLPAEEKPQRNMFEERTIEINGKDIIVWSDMQKDHDNHHCRNLDMQTGRCLVHGEQPFSCDFELIRFIERKERSNILTQKQFGRGWAMLRVDGERGALCYMTDPDAFSIAEVVRKLKRLDVWAQHLGIKTKLVPIIEWAARGPYDKPLIVG